MFKVLPERFAELESLQEDFHQLIENVFASDDFYVSVDARIRIFADREIVEANLHSAVGCRFLTDDFLVEIDIAADASFLAASRFCNNETIELDCADNELLGIFFDDLFAVLRHG